MKIVLSAFEGKLKSKPFKIKSKADSYITHLISQYHLFPLQATFRATKRSSKGAKIFELIEVREIGGKEGMRI